MKKVITSFNEKNQRHGYWELYWTNGKIFYKRFYVNGIENGYEEYYHPNQYLELHFIL